ncbi:MAG: hypothetical protein A2Y15_02255 [Clostridiales bacterium GWF2_36_10]|nr:MAG: hypothetical protein A2Y15_02255 [Clostridiales bacterium GWF2_36_10]HAN21282.1 hypothetical protein [Clostridiales bacterium]
MLKDKLTLMIHSCDKFSDLWDTHILLLNKNWANRNIETFLVTDKASPETYDGVTVFFAGDGAELSERTAAILPYIKTEYVLITLDDYFLTKSISTEKIEDLVSAMEKENLDYIRLFSVPNSKDRIKGYKSLYRVQLSGNYKVNLYPGIWRKSFIEKTIKEPLNAWQYEVSLTKIARKVDAKCAMSKGKEFEILDVVRKGKLLRKANRYLKKHHLYNGSRAVMRFKDEFKLNVISFISLNLPQSFVKYVKRKMIERGHHFYSDVD